MKKSPTIIVIANQKGGVAKTTTTGTFGSGLQQEGKRVLVIDLDPQGNLSTALDADVEARPTIYELMRQKVSADEVIQKVNDFEIIPANVLLSGLEQELTQTGKELRLKEVLEPIMGEYDYILIDTPPSLGILTVNAFVCANEIIIPTTAGLFAAQGITQLYMMMNTVKKYYNPNLKIAGILITKYFPRVNVSKDMKEITEGIGESIGVPIYKTFIRHSVTVEEAQVRRIDVLRYNAQSTVAEDYRAFVREYLGKGGM